MSKLFSPIRVGPYELKHRVVMPPLTRLRADPDDTASAMMAEHYKQRASDGGLIIVESAMISVEARAYDGAPGLYRDEHVAGYRRIADGVHSKGGVVIAQLAHNGRTSHVEMNGGVPPLGPSIVPLDAQALTPTGWKPVSPGREATVDDIKRVIDDFRAAARRAFDADIDGVEIHAANGYLLDSFLQDGTNRRTDRYGGAVENRARILIETVEAIGSLRGFDRVGVRLSPSGEWNSIHDSDPETTFRRVAELLDPYGLAYLHVIEPRVKGDDDKVDSLDHPPVASAFLRNHFSGPIIAAGGFRDAAGAEETLQRGDADLIAFGRWFTSNPDLPERLRRGLPLTKYDRSAFWGGDGRAYVDFLPWQGAEASVA
ncbi:alkene reductase [Nguyenibacter vanlangensis]|uniref:Alkene reductase n=1 Tax=Nguyenibacter vanlangensis TaxID=1216886 RepID=A0A7Y7ISN4_9PROT|nr:alkene reductase [Nguyenibacter vanlangensis]NVN09629.1 alkene reductase [Nguyenibacter vanlangensis]